MLFGQSKSWNSLVCTERLRYERPLERSSQATSLHKWTSKPMQTDATDYGKRLLTLYTLKTELHHSTGPMKPILLVLLPAKPFKYYRVRLCLLYSPS